MKKTAFVLVLVLSTLAVFATDYYSKGSFAPNLTNSWSNLRDGSGSEPANFTGADNFIIQNTHSMTTSATWTVSNASAMVRIESGGELKAVTGFPASITGFFQIDGGGKYLHAIASGSGVSTIPGTAGRRFGNSTNGGMGNGTFEIQAQNTAFSTTGITWGNVVVNNSTQSANMGYAAVFADVEGDFTVKNTNNYQFRFTSTQTTTHIIQGNLSVQNSNSHLVFKSGTGSVDVYVNGNVNLPNGTLTLSLSSGTANLYYGGSFNLLGGTLTEGTSSTNCTVYLNGSTPQGFMRSGGTISNQVNFSVPTGKALMLDNAVIDGDGTFTLASGATLATSNADGLEATGALGAIQVTGTRNYSTGANYQFNGPADIYAGSGFPGTVNGLTLNLLASLTLANDLTVNGTFNVINGTIILGDYDFVATGSVPLNPVFIYDGTGTATGVGTNSVITVQVTTPISLPTQMNQLTVDVGLGSVLHIPNAVMVPNLVFVSGSLAVGNYVLSVGGSPSGTARIIYDGTGRIDCNGSNCEIRITGTNPGTLPGDTGSLIIDLVGTTVLPNNVHLGSFSMVSGSLNLNSRSMYISGRDIDLSGNAVITGVSIALAGTASTIGTQDGIGKTWTITGSSSADINLTFFWDTAEDNGNGFDSGQCHIWRYTSGAWSDLGLRGLNTSEGVRNSNLPFTLGAKDSEGEFTITGEVETLPVELSVFATVLTAENNINVMWTTESETNMAGYYILRSTSNDLGTASRINDMIPATNTSVTAHYIYPDYEAEAGCIWYYWLQCLEMGGIDTFHGPTSVYLPYDDDSQIPGIPVVQGFRSIYPNPFNPTVFITYSLVKDGDVSLAVFNQRGQLIKNLWSGYKTDGNFIIHWDGTNNDGTMCGSGVYFIRMDSGGQHYMRKAVLMK